MTLPIDTLFGLPTPVVADDGYTTYTGSNGSAAAATGITDPDGNNAAYKLQETTATGAHGVYRIQGFANTTTHTFIVYQKSAERTWSAVDFFNGGGDILNNVDLGTPAAGSVYSGGGFSNFRVDALANGWVLISGRFTGTGAGNQNLGFFASTGDNGYSYAGTTNNGIYIYAARVYDQAISSTTIDSIVSHYTGGTGVSGSLATTDRPDVGAIATTIANQAQLATTDRPDAAAIAVSAAMSSVLASTDRPDAAAVTVDFAVPFSGSLASTDRPDAAAVTASLNVFGPLAATEAPDTSSFTASLNVFGPLASTDRPDSAAVSANFVVPLTVSMAATDRPDGMAVDIVLLGIFAVEVTATDRPDSLSAHACTYPWHTGSAVGGGWRPVERICG